MRWDEIKEAYPDQWLILEALEAHSEGGLRVLVQAIPEGPAYAAAWNATGPDFFLAIESASSAAAAVATGDAVRFLAGGLRRAGAGLAADGLGAAALAVASLAFLTDAALAASITSLVASACCARLRRTSR